MCLLYGRARRVSTPSPGRTSQAVPRRSEPAEARLPRSAVRARRSRSSLRSGLNHLRRGMVPMLYEGHVKMPARRTRQTTLTLSEMMTLLMYCPWCHYRTFKHYMAPNVILPWLSRFDRRRGNLQRLEDRRIIVDPEDGPMIGDCPLGTAILGRSFQRRASNPRTRKRPVRGYAHGSHVSPWENVHGAFILRSSLSTMIPQCLPHGRRCGRPVVRGHTSDGSRIAASHRCHASRGRSPMRIFGLRPFVAGAIAASRAQQSLVYQRRLQSRSSKVRNRSRSGSMLGRTLFSTARNCFPTGVGPKTSFCSWGMGWASRP